MARSGTGKKGSMSEIPTDSAGVAKLSWLEDIYTFLYQFRRDGAMLSIVSGGNIAFPTKKNGGKGIFLRGE